MVRISMPTLPLGVPSLLSAITSPEAAIEILSTFLSKSSSTTVLTGAGVSVDSGIRAYRGNDGRYMNPNFQPILYQDLVAPSTKGEQYRQRYWARSYLGYPPVRDAQPNATHFSLAALQRSRFIRHTITQNVDSLHWKALKAFVEPQNKRKALLELHGTLFTVSCRSGHEIDREEFQEQLSKANPAWRSFASDLEKGVQQLRTNPDGDIELDGKSWSDFQVPPCPKCLAEGKIDNNMKPKVIFFGESIPQDVRERSIDEIHDSDQLLIIGTTLVTHSAYRLVQLAQQEKKPVLLLNLGPTRADSSIDLTKLEVPCSDVLVQSLKALGLHEHPDTVVTQLVERANDCMPAALL